MNRASAALLAMLLLTAAPAAAQVAWEAPMLLPPREPSGTGLYVIDAAQGKLGAALRWRGIGWPTRIGIRLGVAEEAGDLVQKHALLLGADFAGTIVRAPFEAPLDVDWIAGAGLSSGTTTVASLPVGLTIGRTFGLGRAGVTPYVLPRLVLDYLPDAADSLEGDVAVDFGLDLALTERFAIRFTGGIGREALALGIVF